MIKATTKTPIIGLYDGTVKDLTEPFKIYAPENYSRALNLAPIYLKYGRKFNIRADIAWAQMIHETGWLKFKGTAKPEWNNFAGIGITGPTAVQKFTSEELGVLAHFVHLCWYVFPDHVNTLCSRTYDPRHFETEGKHHPKYNGDNTIARLGGAWAVPGITYSDKLVYFTNLINKQLGDGLEDVNPVPETDDKIDDKKPPLSDRLDVIVQMGHVGRTKGATGANGEQEFTKKLGLAMENLLQKTSLNYRVMEADNWLKPEPNKTKIFFALHYDGSTNKDARGYSMGFKPNTDPEFKNAMAISFGKLSGFKRRPDNYTSGLKNYYAWTTNKKRPIQHVEAKWYALLEHGFGSNTTERSWMFDNIDKIAKHHVDLIVEFLKGK